MISLSTETEALAKRLAEAQHLSVDDTIRQALEEKARSAGGAPEPASTRQRMGIEDMLTLGAEIASMPFIDPCSPQDIMDDLNAL